MPALTVLGVPWDQLSQYGIEISVEKRDLLAKEMREHAYEKTLLFKRKS